MLSSVLSSFSQSHRGVGFSYLNYSENKGQWDSKVLYKTDFRGGSLFLENAAFTYAFYPKEGLSHSHTKHKEKKPEENLLCHAVRMDFEGANLNHAVSADGLESFYQNFYLGNDPKKWASEVRVFKAVHYGNLYPGIDVKIFGRGNNVRYDFLVAPGADPSLIRLKFTGQDKIALRDGKLVLFTSGGEVIQEAPYAYQENENGEKIKVACDYVLHDRTVSLTIIGDYNKQLPLIIDPTLVFSTYTGSTADNFGMSASFDISGNAYTAGIAFGAGYLPPGILGAYQVSPSGIQDISLSKFNATGNTLMFSTYLGGSLVESPQSITVDNNNCLIVLGRTNSTNFPILAGCYDLIKSGLSDIIVTKFNATGNLLLGSTFIGGSDEDGINITQDSLTSLNRNYADDGRGAVHVDASNNIYVASCTQSADFPTTGGCFQSTIGGMQDGCVFKFNPGLTTLMYSSFLGGSQHDAAYNLALDVLGGVYVTGGTESSNFPTTPNALNTSYGGNIDGFVTHISASGNTILQSTFIGTSSYDQSYFVQVDNDNDVYIYGQCSGNYPITAGTYSNPNSGQFIHKMDSVLGATYFSTQFGTGNGTPDISPSAFLVDNCKSIYISGWGGTVSGFNDLNSTTTGMPITQNAFQPTTDGNDFYFASFTQNATQLQYATFFGGPLSGEHVDGGTSCFDKQGVIYQAMCAGCGGNSDMPTTPGVWSPTNNSANCNNGLVKFQMDLINTIAQANVNSNVLSGCAPFTTNFINGSSNAVDYIWQFGTGATSTATAPVYTYTNVGTYTIQLIAMDSTTCNKSDTAFINITVLPPAQLVPQMAKTKVCKFESVQLPGVNFPAANGYSWTPPSTLSNPSINNPIASPTVNTIYTLTLNDGLCQVVSSRTVLVEVFENITDIIDQTLCSGDTITLKTTDTYTSYSWSNGATTSSITGLLVGLYTVNTIDSNGCKGFDSSRIYVRIPIPPSSFTMCEGFYTQLLAPQGNYQFTWTPASLVSDPGIWNPYAAPPSTTFYTLTLGNGPCFTSNTFSVYIKPRPKALITTNGANLCLTDTVILKTLTAPSYESYIWNTGDTTSTIIVTQHGDYTVTVTDTNGCVTMDTLTLNRVPPYSVENKSVTICEGESTVLIADTGYTYRWFPEYRMTGQNESQVTVFPINSTAYTLLISNKRCTSAVIHSVIVSPAPSLSLAFNQKLILPGESVQLLSFSDTRVYWSPDIELNCADCPNPVVSPLETTTYYCHIIDQYGCTNTHTVLIEVAPTLYIPNCFTPNGDSYNDIFKPEHTGYEKMKMAIYDRWGELLFSKEGLDVGWNGHFKGKVCQDGQYVYKLYATDNRRNYIEKVGTVLLMK